MGKSKDNSGVWMAALAGAVIGSTVAVLYAPRSGRETRTIIKKEVESTTEKLNDTVLDLKESVVEKLDKDGNGLGYFLGSQIARIAFFTNEIMKALDKELKDLEIKNVI